MVAAHPPRLVETTEPPDTRWVATAEKVWATTHPINQGLAIVGIAVVTVALVRTLPRLVPLLRAWRGQGDEKAGRTPDAPSSFTPPPEPSLIDKRMDQLLAVTEDMARKLQKVEQGVHNVSAEVSILDKRIGRIEDRLTTAVTRDEMGIALKLVSDLAVGR